MNKIEYDNIIAFHPGYYLKMWIEKNQISQEELAKRLQTSPKYVSDLVNGRINLSEDMALNLASLCGTSVSMWLNLNKTYIEKKLEIEEECKLEKEYKFLDCLDYKYWNDLGFVQKTKDKKEKVKELLGFFKIASLEVLASRDFLVQFKAGFNNISDVKIINANAWVQTAINIGKTAEVAKFNKRKLLETVKEIRTMVNRNPKEVFPEIKERLADCGVALVLLPNLKNCGVNGAVKWIDKEKVVLALNDRRKYTDIFWFALFHEIGHVLQQRIKVMNISSDYRMNDIDNVESYDRLEKEADEFAKNILVPKDKYDFFIEQNGIYTVEVVKRFSDEIGVAPGIVVGRLQKDEKLTYKSTLNKLKDKYSITS